MAHPSYRKGARYENRVREKLCKLGSCKRSTMSLGKDLILTRMLRRWSVSCKCRAQGKGITVREIKAELATHDLCIEREDRAEDYVHMKLSTFIEFCGDEDVEVAPRQYSMLTTNREETKNRRSIS